MVSVCVFFVIVFGLVIGVLGFGFVIILKWCFNDLVACYVCLSMFRVVICYLYVVLF